MKNVKSLFVLPAFLFLSLVVTSCGTGVPGVNESSPIPSPTSSSTNESEIIENSSEADSTSSIISSSEVGENYSLRIAGERTYSLRYVDGYYYTYVSVKENDSIDVYKDNVALEIDAPTTLREDKLENNNIKKDTFNKFYAVEEASKALFEYDAVNKKAYLGHKAYCVYANDQEVARLNINRKSEDNEYYTTALNLEAGTKLKVEYDGKFVEGLVRKDVNNNNLTTDFKVMRSGEISVYFNVDDISLFASGYYDLHNVSIGNKGVYWMKPVEDQYVLENVTVEAGDKLTFYTDNNVIENIPISPYNRHINNISDDYKILVGGEVTIYINDDGQLYITGYKKIYEVSIGNKKYSVEDNKYFEIPSIKKGDVVTAKLDGEAVTLSCSGITDYYNFLLEDDYGIKAKRDSLDGEKLELCIHTSATSRTSVFIKGYSPLYEVTIGTNKYTLIYNDKNTDLTKREYCYLNANVKKGEVISVTLDGNSITTTRKLDADTTPVNEINNITDNGYALLIHNDANPASIYMEYGKSAIYVSGYRVDTESIVYYLGVDDTKIPLTPDADDAYQHYAKGINVNNNSVIRIYDTHGDRVTGYEYADPATGNNLTATLRIISGGKVDIYLKTNDKNIWVSQPLPDFTSYELVQSSSAYNLSKTRVLFVYSWSTKLSGTVDYVSYIEDGHVNVIDNFTGMIIGYLKSGRTKADGLGESWTNVDYSRKSDDFLNPGSSFTSINVTIDSVGKPVITVS